MNEFDVDLLKVVRHVNFRKNRGAVFNIFADHIRQLEKKGYVVKLDDGYWLTEAGIAAA
jgi:hypothetical protein